MPALPDIRPHLKRLEALQPLLLPLGVTYGLLMRARRWAYEGGTLASWRPPCPCVSVGNIGLGGSGKTPLCEHILRWAEARQELCVALTRGYGGKPRRLPLWVTPGADPAQCGDEPLLLAGASPGARVVVDPRRSRSGPWAWARFEPDLMLLDDGFQHLPVRRDLDLVLMTPGDLRSGWGRVFPGGSWREGVSALSRASAFCLKVTEEELSGLRGDILKRLERLERPVFTFAMKPLGLKRLGGHESARDLGGAEWLFACGLGLPEQAASTAARLLGRAPAATLAFPDHHAYTAKDVERMEQAAREAGAAHIVVTAKDAVKLARLPETGRFWMLAARPVFGPSLWSDEPFDAWFASRYDELAARHRAEYRAEILK